MDYMSLMEDKRNYILVCDFSLFSRLTFADCICLECDESLLLCECQTQTMS